MIDVFHYLDYKEFILDKIKENESVHGYRSKLAKAANCQNPFLSQALNGSVQLTPEHALGLSLFWKFSNLEKEFFITLLNLSRSGSSQLSEYYNEKLKNLKKAHDNLGKRYAQEKLTEDAAALYYSSWHFSAIHILTTIPGFFEVDKIAKRLGLEEKLVEKTLHQLKKIGLMEFEDSKWKPSKKFLHVPNNSHLHTLYHQLWRQKAIHNSLAHPDQSTHYTALVSISKKDAEKLRQLTIEFIDRSREIVPPSEEEELVCMNVDYFVVN